MTIYRIMSVFWFVYGVAFLIVHADPAFIMGATLLCTMNGLAADFSKGKP